jgi:hypothetical protein
MADKKISALTGASTPLAGTEVLPIVQGGATVKVSAANITAGRAVSVASLSAVGSGAGGTQTLATFNAAADAFSNSVELALEPLISGQSRTGIGAQREGVGTGAAVYLTAGGNEVLRGTVAGNITVNTGNLVIGTTGKGLTTGSAIPLGFGTNNSVADMTLDTSGNLILGSTNLGGKLSVFTGSGVGQFIRVQQINATLMEFRNAQDVGGNITIVAGGATSFNTVSDERLKHAIVDAPDAANLIDALQVRSFKWKVDDTAQRYGFIAQELLEVAPEAVNVPEDEDKMMGVDHSKLVPMLVKEVQSLRARVAQLEGK